MLPLIKEFLPSTVDFKKLIFLGVLLGIASFWNGAVVISSVIIISALAVLFRRLDLFLIVILAVVITQAQSYFFVGSDSPVSPALHLGFLSSSYEQGALYYYIMLFGVLSFISFFAFFTIKTSHKLWFLAFLGPFLFANIVQLTPDLNLNHKFINVSVLLINIFIAYFLVHWSKGHVVSKYVAPLVLILLTFSGVIDLFGLINFNSVKQSYQVNHPLTVWAQTDTNRDDVFLTDAALYHPVLWAGRSVFLGWPYFVSSAGYDLKQRADTIRQIYASRDPEELKRLLNKNDIQYIVVSPAVKSAKLNEEFLEIALTRVWHNADLKTSVYGLPAR